MTGALEFMSEKYRKTWNHLLDMDNIVHVPCRPMTDILAEAGITTVDFMSVDTQGAEDILLTRKPWLFRWCLWRRETLAQRKTSEFARCYRMQVWCRSSTRSSHKRIEVELGYELFAQPYLIRQRIPDETSAGMPAPSVNGYPGGTAAILSPAEVVCPISVDRHSRLSRFLDGLIAMDQMTAVIREERSRRGADI